jgi:[ribosomal protein S5]-alanine N-acetyltransferase
MFIRDHRGFLHLAPTRFGNNHPRDFFRLQTPRMILEAIEPAHASVLFEGLRDNALYQFIDDGPPESVESLRKRYERWAQRLSPDAQEIWLNWALKLSETDNYVGVIQATVRKDRSAVIAFVLFRDHWGQGYAQEAVTEMIRELRERYAVTRCTATVDPGNDRSIHLLRNLGFEQTGIYRNATTIRGTLADEAHYSRSTVIESLE